MWTGIAVDPDIGEPTDDTAALLEIDGAPVLLIWDADFVETGFDGRPGFLALVPLDNPGTEVNMTQMSDGTRPGVQPVPQTDREQYEALSGLREPTFASPFFDLRALIGVGSVDLAEGAVARAAMAFVWAEAVGEVPEVLLPSSPELTVDAPFLVTSWRRCARSAKRTTIGSRISPRCSTSRRSLRSRGPGTRT